MSTLAADETTAVQKARAVLLVLEHAEQIGLPLPFTHTVAEYSDPDTAPVSFGFDRLDQVTDWVLWMESTITTVTTLSGQIVHKARGNALDLPIEVWSVESPTEKP